MFFYILVSLKKKKQCQSSSGGTESNLAISFKEGRKEVVKERI
jgi:hypothetical protein